MGGTRDDVELLVATSDDERFGERLVKRLQVRVLTLQLTFGRLMSRLGRIEASFILLSLLHQF